VDWYDYGARFYDPSLARFHTQDPHAENYLSWTPYNYVGNNPILLIDPDGRDWYRHDENNAVKWRPGNDAVEGYSNIGESYTHNIGDGVSITYNQNTPESMTETILNAEDWSSQINNPELGDCFAHSGIMVSASGATSLGGEHNNEPAANAIDYINSQVNQGHSTRVHVDRIDAATGAAERGDRGVHWVAISSRTTNLRTGQATSFGFFEPGTGRPAAGTSPSNLLNVGRGSLTGPTRYDDRFTYSVTAVRRNR
jgi:hypothetical protein